MLKSSHSDLPPWMKASSSSSQKQQEMTSLPSSSPTVPDNHSPKKKKNKLKKFFHNGRLQNNSRDIYMNINLQDLESYTQDVLEAERERQRQCYIKVGCIVLGLLVLIGGSAYAMSSDFLEHVALTEAKKHDNNIPMDGPIALELPQDYLDYPLSMCEQEINNGVSFYKVVQVLQDDQDPVCRVEVPDCDYQDPVIPKARDDSAAWSVAVQHNQERIADLVEQNISVDVALIGDSLVEHMQGQELGFAENSLKREEEVFVQLFTKQGGGKVDGIALGIAGDRCNNLLYRLQHSILTQRQFQPKVWWIVMGTQDWYAGVESDVIVAGIVAIVLTIKQVHPDAQIVINSLLPQLVDTEAIEAINDRLACFVRTQNLMDQDLSEQGEIKSMMQVEQDTTTLTAFNNDDERLQHLHFFNATNIFMAKKDDGTFAVNPAFMMPDDIETHPDAHGEFLWGDQIANAVLALINAQK